MVKNPLMVVGIDPGASGGMCMKDSFGNHFACNMPPTIFGVKDTLDTWIIEFFSEVRSTGYKATTKDPTIVVYLESTNQIPFRPRGDSSKTGQGLASTAKFAKSVGRLEGLLCGMGIKHHLISPQKWMKALNCMTGGNKKITRNLAIKMYPELKPTHATSDAILITEYGEQCERSN